MTHRRHWLALLLTGCMSDVAILGPAGTAGSDIDEGDEGPVATDDALSCSSQIAWMNPESGAELVPVDAPLSVGFDAALGEDASWSLTVSGVSGTAALSADRLSATFTPDAPLSTESTYTLSATACAESVERSFTTRGPSVSAEDLEGRSWVLDMADAEWVAPASSPVFVPLLDLPSFMLQVDTSSGAPHLIGRFAGETGEGPAPLPCAPVLDFGVLDLSDSPRFTTTEDSLEFRWLGMSMSASALHLSGSFAHGGSAVAELSLGGLIDTRIVEALTGVESLCEQSAALNEPCEPCADGANSCLQAFVVQHETVEAPPTDLYSDWFADLGLCEP